jgi:DNA-binding transcriptional ArsR family regulator
MNEGPDIAQIASLIGDPARANMLAALTGGRALTATELAGIGGITLPTASAHLSKLEAGGLLSQRKQGRHRYFTLADEAAARLIETMMGFASSRGHLRYRPGPKDPALRKARVCYDHLAGDFGVRMLDSFVCHGEIASDGENLTVTEKGPRAACGIRHRSLKPCLQPPPLVQILPRLERAPVASGRHARQGAACPYARQGLGAT